MDNRLFRRRSSAIDFKVYEAETFHLLGRLGDLSEGGLLLYGTETLATDQLYRLSVHYPDADGQLQKAVFEAKAVWAGPDVNPELKATGFRLFHLDNPEIRQQLDTLMARFTVGSDEVADDD